MVRGVSASAVLSAPRAIGEPTTAAAVADFDANAPALLAQPVGPPTTLPPIISCAASTQSRLLSGRSSPIALRSTSFHAFVTRGPNVSIELLKSSNFFDFE